MRRFSEFIVSRYGRQAQSRTPTFPAGRHYRRDGVMIFAEAAADSEASF